MSRPRFAYNTDGPAARALGDPDRFRLTLDVGHCPCVGDEPPPDAIRPVGGRPANVHVEDMRREIDEHPDCGEGEIDSPPVLEALREVDYRGPIGVELSRHGHAAGVVVPGAIESLRESERKEAPV